MSVQFEWDPIKENGNRRKHKIGFEEAASVYDDPLAVLFEDAEHSSDEQRGIIIGHSIRNRLLLVSYTEREDTIRIISARQVTRKERRDYEERLPNI